MLELSPKEDDCKVISGNLKRDPRDADGGGL